MEPLTPLDDEEENEAPVVGGPAPSSAFDEGYVYDLPEESVEDYTDEPTPPPTDAGQQPVIEPVVEDPSVYELPEATFEEYTEPTPEGDAVDAFELDPAMVEDYEGPEGVTREEAFIPEMEEGQDYLRREDITSNPERMQIVRDYMVFRNGDQYREIDDETLYDDYINTMRYVNSNELSLGYDASLLALGEEGGMQKMARAYELYGQLGNFYQTDGFWGGADAVKDYAWSVATSPMTYLGLGVGKVYTQIGMQGGKKAAMAGVIALAKQAATKELAATGATKAAINARAAALAREGAKSVIRRQIGKETAVMAASEGTFATWADSMHQNHMINVGVQDEWSWGRTAASFGLGAAITAIPGTIGAARAGKELETVSVKNTVEAGNAAFAESMYGTVNLGSVKKGVTALKGRLIDWDKAVQNGDTASLGSVDHANELLAGVFGIKEGNIGVVPQMMIDAGVTIRKDERATQQMLTFLDRLSDADTVDLDVMFADTLGEGLTLTAIKDSLATHLSGGASVMQSIAQAAKTLSDDVTMRNLSAKGVVEAGEEVVEAPISKLNDVVHYTQSAWKRALVAHPATSMVNVIGWTQAAGARQMALLTSGAYYGTTGWAAKLASPFSATAKKFADENLKKAAGTFKAVGNTLGMILSPNATREHFETILKGWDTQMTNAKGVTRDVHIKGIPEKYAKQLDRASYSTGGLQKTRLEESNALPIRAVEGYLTGARIMSLSRWQDSMTKSLSFMSALDASLLRRTGKSYAETIKVSGMKGIPDEVWNDATRAALRDTMSADYTKHAGMFSKTASLVETISNNGVTGWFMPFGRFMNNALAFSYQYSPVGVMRLLNKHPGESAVDILSQAVVGSTALYFAFEREGIKAEKGIPWYVEEGNDGAMYDFTNLAPGSAYSLMGRITYHLSKGDNPVDKEVLKDLLMQLGSASVLATFDKTNDGMTDKLINIFGSLANEDSEEKSIVEMTLTGLAYAGAGVFAGFTRPIEPLSQIAAGHDLTLVDRSGLEGMDAVKSEALRYVDGFFLPFLEEAERPVRYDAINPRGHKVPNVVSKLAGLRQTAAQTATERLFAEAFYPEWKANQKSNMPELDRVVNQRIDTALEERSKDLLGSERWIKADLATRRKLVQQMLKGVREDTVEWITADESSDEAVWKLRDTYSRKPENLRKRAQEAFGITKDIKELSPREIMELNEYIDYLSQEDKELLRQ